MEHHAALFELNKGHGAWHSGLGGPLPDSHLAEASSVGALLATVAQDCQRKLWAPAAGDQEPRSIAAASKPGWLLQVRCCLLPEFSMTAQGQHRRCRLSTRLTRCDRLLLANKLSPGQLRLLSVIGLGPSPYRMWACEFCHGLKAVKGLENYSALSALWGGLVVHDTAGGLSTDLCPGLPGLAFLGSTSPASCPFRSLHLLPECRVIGIPDSLGRSYFRVAI